MARKKDRTGLVVFLVIMAAALGVGGYFGWGWYRVSQERETWGPTIARLLPVFNEGLEQVSEVSPDTETETREISGPVLVWNRNDNCVLHLSNTAGREATDPSGGFTLLMAYKKVEATGMYLERGGHRGTAPMKQYTLSVIVIDPRDGALLGAHKIFGSQPPSFTNVKKGFTGPDDVYPKFNYWLGQSLR